MEIKIGGDCGKQCLTLVPRFTKIRAGGVFNLNI